MEKDQIQLRNRKLTFKLNKQELPSTTKKAAVEDIIPEEEPKRRPEPMKRPKAKSMVVDLPALHEESIRVIQTGVSKVKKMKI